MNRLIYIPLLFAVLSTGVKAQNLVPNPSFEEYNNCPQGGFSIPPMGSYFNFPTVQNWISASAGTPDYFNTCSPDTLAIPCNFFGCQYPHSGNAYTGLITTSRGSNPAPGSREYIETKLRSTLIAGHSYFVSMYISLAGPFSNRSFISTDRIGFHFSDTQVSEYKLYLSLPSHINSPPGWFISDTTTWVKIEGIYTANGNEQWMTIGRFFDSSETDTVIYQNTTGSYVCYMYVDDVCVRDINLNSSDTTICVQDFPSSVSGISAEGTYIWNTGATTASINVTEPGTYWRRVTGECLYYIDTIHVLQQPKLRLASDTVLCNNIPTQLNEPLSGVNYQWNIGSTNCCIIPTVAGTYAVEAYNACGSVRDSIEISFINCDNCIKFPSVFSPNGDGKNDRFGPILRCSKDFSFYSFNIYDRWGVRVFSSTSPDHTWDGTYRGTNQNVDTYSYYLRYSNSSDNKMKMFKGNVTLLR